MSLVRKCIKLVDNNFFFKDGEREKWDINKKKLISEIKAVKTQEETLSIIDKYLIDLKDPHEKKGMICKDPEVNSNFQEVFYFLKIRVYFP